MLMCNKSQEYELFTISETQRELKSLTVSYHRKVFFLASNEKTILMFDVNPISILKSTTKELNPSFKPRLTSFEIRHFESALLPEDF